LPPPPKLAAIELLRAKGYDVKYRNAGDMEYDKHHIEDGFAEMRFFTAKSI
jgi:hypothetical protein